MWLGKMSNVGENMTVLCIRCGNKVEKSRIKKSKICEDCHAARSKKTKKNTKAS